jgi:hypothetical protein
VSSKVKKFSLWWQCNTRGVRCSLLDERRVFAVKCAGSSSQSSLLEVETRKVVGDEGVSRLLERSYSTVRLLQVGSRGALGAIK